MSPSASRFIREVAAHCGALESSLVSAGDERLRAVGEGLRQRVDATGADPGLVAETTALVREVGRRLVGIRLFDVQVMAAAALHQGWVVEMATGEGKTLAAVSAVLLSAWGGGAHVATANEYLAGRDAGWMGPIYQFFGIQVGVVTAATSGPDKRRAYRCPVTYGTATEFGFDFLRDRLGRPVPALQQERYFRWWMRLTACWWMKPEPLSSCRVRRSRPVRMYQRMAVVAAGLTGGVDYPVDQPRRMIHLSDTGIARAERLLGVENMFAESDQNLVFRLDLALQAKDFLLPGRDYVVVEGTVTDRR